MTIDGADEVDPELDLIKGAGGAWLHEKILAQASRREIIIVDETKLSPHLGARASLPVEVIPFGWRSEERFLRSLGAEPVLRRVGDHEVVTEEGNFILDCRFRGRSGPKPMASALDSRAGVAAHGLFLGLVSDVIVGVAAGVKHLRSAR